jgi:hypothetical protein
VGVFCLMKVLRDLSSSAVQFLRAALPLAADFFGVAELLRLFAFAPPVERFAFVATVSPPDGLSSPISATPRERPYAIQRSVAADIGFMRHRQLPRLVLSEVCIMQAVQMAL